MSLSTYQRLMTWLRSDTLSSDTPSVREQRIADRPCGMQELEPRMLLSAVLTEAIPTLYIPSSGGTAVVDLTNYFDDELVHPDTGTAALNAEALQAGTSRPAADRSSP